MSSNKFVAQTDWLGLKPVFYDEEKKIASYSFSELVENEKYPFEDEGLYFYNRFGYSAFGKTPIKNIKYLLPNQKIIADGRSLEIITLEDPVDKYWNYSLEEDEILDLIKSRIREWETKIVNGDKILIPMSGGYDSRLLASLVTNKNLYNGYTYGASMDQERSEETVIAKQYAKKLGIKWEQIPIGDFHQDIETWVDKWGCLTHATGMYHIEFYKKIKQKNPEIKHLLSGVIGDAWSGGVRLPDEVNEESFDKILYTHGMHADPYKLKNRNNNYSDRIQGYIKEKKNILSEEKGRIIEAMRFKMILLNYLLEVPSWFGMKCYSPFLDIDIAMAMLNLPEERRKSRTWQTEFFKRIGIDNSDFDEKYDRYNNLNIYAMDRNPVEPLDKRELDEIFEEGYIDRINDRMFRKDLYEKAFRNITKIPYTKRGLKLLGIKDRRLDAYLAYLTLLPLEKYLLKCKDK